MNPEMVVTVEYEKPVKGVMDYLLQRKDVNPDKMALYGLLPVKPACRARRCL